MLHLKAIDMKMFLLTIFLKHYEYFKEYILIRLEAYYFFFLKEKIFFLKKINDQINK